ncbi:MAG: DUF2175 domain-containing protein [Desulfurococcales archaeon]|nr:DUF2175 domain-containing protein [Desulfurococcales archaeon]
MSSPKYKSWKCGLCGEPVIEGQRMVVLGKYGYVHVECFYEYLKKKYPHGIPRDILALSDANEALAYAIVRLKQAQRISDEESGFLLSTRNKIEDLAEEIDVKLSEKLGL